MFDCIHWSPVLQLGNIYSCLLPQVCLGLILLGMVTKIHVVVEDKVSKKCALCLGFQPPPCGMNCQYSDEEMEKE